MIIKLENARKTYETIIKRVKKSNGKIVIFVGFDIDSLCSLRILVSLLRMDHARYEIIPVENYNQFDIKLQELKEYYEDPFNKRDIKAIVMINCGGTRDMSQLWFNDESYELNILLVDVHRPSHHKNIHSSQTILIIDDNCYEIDYCPTDEDMKIIMEADEDEDQDEETSEKLKEKEDSEINEDDAEKEDVESELDKENKARKIKKKKDDLDTIEEENEDDVDKLVDSVRTKKTKKSAIEIEKVIKRKVKERIRTKAHQYYSGNYFGFPSAFIFYKIASQRGVENNQMLWLLIVAMTEHYLQSHIDQELYDVIYKECHLEALRLNSSDNLENFSYQKQLKKEEQDENGNQNQNNLEELDKHDFSDVRNKTVNKSKSSIIVEADYRLSLYKHWNLFDSLVFSSYTLAHLNTWKEPGKEDIKKLLTLLGIPLEQAKQNYPFMKNEYKEIFKRKITEVCRKFDLKDLVFLSFVYQFDQKTQLTASDYVHCLSVILDYPYNLHKAIKPDDFPEFEEVNDDQVTEEEKTCRMKYKYQNFWTSYDFLSFKNPKILKKTIGLAIEFQKMLAQQSIIQLNSVNSFENFRLALIKSDSEENKYFLNSLSLERLALLIQYSYHRKKNVKPIQPKPFVLAISNEDKKSYIVAGVVGNAREYSIGKNQFSIRFRMAASKIGAQIKLDSFNDCIIEISKDDFGAFHQEITREW